MAQFFAPVLVFNTGFDCLIDPVSALQSEAQPRVLQHCAQALLLDRLRDSLTHSARRLLQHECVTRMVCRQVPTKPARNDMLAREWKFARTAVDAPTNE
jgi:hypothetical protein